jgi:catechol 2,3-dioxygenase-like lactoylglutathione lyase family enzyme
MKQSLVHITLVVRDYDEAIRFFTETLRFTLLEDTFLSTDDFWRDYHAMRANGVPFVREPTQAPYGTVAVFEDLYGNRWDLIGYVSEHPLR